MSARKNIYEVFDEFEKATTDEARKQVLVNNNSHALRSILRANYHPNIKFVFDKIPNYRSEQVPVGMGYSSIDQEINRLYLFEMNNPRVPKELTGQRAVQLLQGMLESLEPREAKVLADTILKKLEVKGLTKALASEVFTDIEN